MAGKCQCKYAESFRGNETFPLEIQPQTLIIPEKDVYRLIMRSKLSKAEEFQDWVMDEVLPSIRSHGFYGTEDFVAKEIAVALGYANTAGAIQKHCKYPESFKGNVSLPLKMHPKQPLFQKKMFTG